MANVSSDVYVIFKPRRIVSLSQRKLTYLSIHLSHTISEHEQLAGPH